MPTLFMAAPIDPTEKPTKGFMDWSTVNTLTEVAFTRGGKGGKAVFLLNLQHNYPVNLGSAAAFRINDIIKSLFQKLACFVA